MHLYKATISRVQAPIRPPRLSPYTCMHKYNVHIHTHVQALGVHPCMCKYSVHVHVYIIIMFTQYTNISNQLVHFHTSNIPTSAVCLLSSSFHHHNISGWIVSQHLHIGCGKYAMQNVREFPPQTKINYLPDIHVYAY